MRLEQSIPDGVEGLIKIIDAMKGGRDANP